VVPESTWPAAGGMVQRLVLKPILVHVLVCDQDNGMCCASLRFAGDTKLERNSRYAGKETGLLVS